MTPDEIRAVISNIRIWSSGRRRAPHKPLLLLLSIGQCLRGKPRMASYKDIDGKLQDLLRRYGPPRQVVHTEQPFWRLQNDGIWEVSNAGHVTVNSGGDPLKSSMRDLNVRGGFLSTIYKALRDDDGLAFEIAVKLLEAHFPSTLHESILRDVGIDLQFALYRRQPRDPEFAPAVLNAYRYRCAVCEFNIQLEERHLGLDAAHIKWHAAKGPDLIPNALSLCVLHHRLFDSGAFTVNRDRRVEVSELVQGSGLKSALGRYNTKTVFLPKSTSDYPDYEFLDWHRSEVFRRIPDKGGST